ncbi:ArsR/SmtB family transcription factor [Shouchella patagoniensis]|uniref:ArsR/SmtB family transcription factor n=1 Tax=Shouchella patagoniensis TaxID=228576 RepID=UPI0009950807|nr:ArsR family transcriptional regulator [Shouchella patagoniensis]
MLELSINEPEKLRKVSHALSTEIRIRMVQLLSKQSYSVHDLANLIHIPVSTAASNVNVLTEAGLIVTELRPASRGAMKMCTRNFDDIHIALNHLEKREVLQSYEMNMPIGHYVDFFATPTCGMADKKGMVLNEDEPGEFYHPDRVEAQILWTRTGFFEYKFPFQSKNVRKIRSFTFSCELCSEAPNYNDDWPSDITVWVNGVDIGTWTSPGDFGDRPGKLNPTHWYDNTRTQYGSLKTWEVNEKQAMIDYIPCKAVQLADLHLQEKQFITIRIGIKEDAEHKGGMNLFGKAFGDYPQDLKVGIHFYE